MISIKPVPVEYVNQTWPLVAGYIEAALTTEFEGEAVYTVDHVQGFVATGQWMLCVAVDEDNNIHGAGTIIFSNYPRHRVAFISTVGGKLICSRDTVEQVKNLARQNGATILQACGRPAIVRLWRRYNFKPINMMLEQLL